MKPERWKEIEGLYHAALEKSAEERAAFLEGACDLDAELRREVESLLARHSGADGFIEKPALETAARDLVAEADSLVGQQIASYRIVELLGTGGMGQVFLADDSNLKRRVALKFLPPHLQAHERARRRFQREARSAAAIDHPYICSIYEVGTAGGRDFIAMEHVEGQTLADRLAEGPLPIDEALTTALEIAEAVEAAHASGIVHRDLKPSNVMLTAAGHAKVMDFGLAKRLTAEEASESDSPDDLTAEGSTPGTIAYMSPDQLKGGQVDARSDVFSFGVMLFEMLAGVHPFRRATPAETTGAILKESPPPLARFLPDASDAIGHIVRKMLAKEPGLRHQSMHEVRTELEQLLEDPERLVAGVPPRWQAIVPWALVPLVAIIAWVAAGWTSEPDPSAFSDLKTRIQFPEGTRLTHGRRHGLSVSPDGKMVAFVAGPAEHLDPRAKTSHIYVQPLNQWDAQPVPGTEEGMNPVFSPSGRSLAFYQRGELKKVALDGSDPVTLCECEIFHGFAWESETTIVVTPQTTGPLFRVSATGNGRLQEVTRLDRERGEQGHWLPHFLPGREELLFTAVPFGSEGFRRDWPRASIVWKSLLTGERRVVIENATDARYVPTGHLVFAREGRLMAVEFDSAKRETIGTPVQILDGVSHSSFRAAQFSFSAGVMAYVPGSLPPERFSHIVRFNPTTGVKSQIDLPAEVYSSLQVSPDGKRLLLVFSRWSYNGVWLYDIETGALDQQTFEDDGIVTYAIWGPEPDQFTYDSRSHGVTGLYVKRLNSGRGGATERLETGLELPHFPGAWSSDGRFLIFIAANPDNRREEPARRPGGFDLWKLARGGKAEPLVKTGKSVGQPALSHDNNWLAYRHGALNLCALPRCDVERTVADYGVEPYWSKNDSRLFFREIPEGRIWPHGLIMQALYWVPVVRGDAQLEGRRELAFIGDWTGGGWPLQRGGFDANGNLIVLENSRDQFDENLENLYPSEIRVVTNWFDELRRQVPQEN